MPVVTLTTANSIIKDTSIMNWAPTTNNASSVGIGVGINSNGLQRSFLKFDLGLIPNDAIINSATLNLFASPTVSGRTIEIHKVTSDWIDTSVTWNSAPGFDSSISTTAITGSTAGTMNFNITDLVQTWVNGVTPNYGMALKDSNETGSNNATTFNSTEASSNKPTITIDYSIPTTGKKQVEYVSRDETFKTGSSNITIGIPVRTQKGDLLIASVNNNDSSVPITPPTGWTKLHDTARSGPRYSLWYKFAGDNETGPTFSCSNSSVNWIASMIAYRNVKAVREMFYATNITGNTLRPPNATTAYDNTIALLINVLGNYAAHATPPLSFKEVVDYGWSDVQMTLADSFKYMYKNKSLQSSEMGTSFSESGSGDSRVIFLEPLSNTPPTLTLTSPSNNQTLTEGSTYTLAGTASDPDAGNAVTVKYSINGGTARNITSAVSDGSTPIPFSKVLTFQNGRLYDGSTDVSGPLAENTTYTVSVYAVDDHGGTSPSYTRSFKVILNRPPNITLDPYNANQTGLSVLETLTFTGTVTDPENQDVNLTVSFNGGDPVTLKSGVPSGTKFEYKVLVSTLASGSNIIVFTATDSKGAPTTKTLTLNKTGTQTPVRTAVTRYSITPPLGSTAEIVAWVNREAGDLTVDAAYSIVGSDANESYTAMTKNASVPVGDGAVYEDEFVGTSAQAGPRVTLRLTLNRTDVNATKAVKKIMGGIG